MTIPLKQRLPDPRTGSEWVRVVYLGEGDTEPESLHPALPCPPLPILHSLSAAPVVSLPCCQNAQGRQGHI